MRHSICRKVHKKRQNKDKIKVLKSQKDVLLFNRVRSYFTESTGLVGDKC